MKSTRWILPIMLVASGCATPSVRQSVVALPEEKPTYLFAEIDVSDSCPDSVKLGYARRVLDQIEDLDPDHDRLGVFVFDHHIRQVGSEVPSDPDGFGATLRKVVLKPFADVDRETNTSQGAAIAALAEQIKQVDTKRFHVRILVSTDGDFDDHSATAERLYRRSVEAISAVPDVEVIFHGVMPGNYEDLKAEWKALDKRGRFHILGRNEDIQW